MMIGGIRTFLGAVAVSLVAVGPAQSATVTIGAFSFDDSAFADTATIQSGFIPGAANIVGGNLDTFASLSTGDVLEVGFTDNVLGNGAGIDLLVFEGFSSLDSPGLSLTLGGTSIAGSLLQTIAANTLPGVDQETNIYGFDLDAFAIAAGAVVAGNLFFNSNGNAPELSAVAAINSGTTAVVPLPAALPLLASALGLFGLFGWRRKRAATA